MEKYLNPPHKRLRVFDFLRIAAALWVLVFHLSWQAGFSFPADGILTQFVRYGFLGVDVFFFISGYLTAWHYAPIRDLKSYKSYLIARLIRLYPLHGIMLLFLGIVVAIAPFLNIAINNPNDYNLSKLLQNIFLVSAWQFPATMSWNYFAWALSALWLAVLLTPFFFYLFKKFSSKKTYIFFGLFFAVLTPLTVYFHSYPSFVAYAIPRAIGGFGLGITLYFLTKDQISDKDFSGSKILHYAADLTYALYMVQYPVLLFFKKIFPPIRYADHTLVYLSVEIFVCIFAAIAAHHIFEKPMTRFLKMRFKG